MGPNHGTAHAQWLTLDTPTTKKTQERFPNPFWPTSSGGGRLVVGSLCGNEGASGKPLVVVVVVVVVVVYKKQGFHTITGCWPRHVVDAD